MRRARVLAPLPRFYGVAGVCDVSGACCVQMRGAGGEEGGLIVASTQSLASRWSFRTQLRLAIYTYQHFCLHVRRPGGGFNLVFVVMASQKPIRTRNNELPVFSPHSTQIGAQRRGQPTYHDANHQQASHAPVSYTHLTLPTTD